VYTDYEVTEDLQNIPGIKIGDGTTVVKNLPFIAGGNITESDIENWNNKVAVKVNPGDDEDLILYNNE
jgi:hypothetical protein